MTQEMLDDLARQIKTVTTELGKAIVEMVSFLLNVIDPLMFGYERREPRFFEEYRNSRRIGGRTSDKHDEKKEESAKPAAEAKVEAGSTGEQMTSEGWVVDQDDEADAALAQVTGETEATPAARGTNLATDAALSS